jgi:hypothetical protein
MIFTNILNIYKQFKWVLGFLPSSQCGGQFALAFHKGWSEPATTNAPVHDEAVLTVLG